MNNKLERKFGLFTAICMVVGIVIGSGVFFKAQDILNITRGNMPMGILAWAIGGIIMLVCILAFSAMAQRYERVNGVVDYSEAVVGRRYAYMMGWFMTMIYYPAMTSVLAWLSARYTLVFITSCWPDFPLLIPASQGGCVIGPECIALMLLFMCCSYGLNALSPKLAGHFQTTTTVIKLVPLVLMAVGGIISGLVSPTHLLKSNFATASVEHGGMSSLLSAVCATAFAYEGWIIATSINSELKNSKKNLPRALVLGGIVVMTVYISYYVGVAGGASVEVLRENGATTAFTNVFGGVLGNVLNLFVAISCMGTLNGLMLGSTRGMYSIAIRGEGPRAETFAQVDKKTNMAHNSAVIGLLLCAAWGVYFYLSQLAGTLDGLVVFRGTALESAAFKFDSSEIPIITIYAMYLPIFVMWMKKEKTLGAVQRFVLPVLAFLGSCFMVYACIVRHKMGNVWYLIVFAVVMAIGALFMKKEKV